MLISINCRIRVVIHLIILLYFVMVVFSYSLFAFNNVRFRFNIPSIRCFCTPSGRGSAAATFKGHSESEGNIISTSPLKGTRDFYPNDMRVRSWLEGKWKGIAHQFGFEQYDAPILENEELYLRKAGEEISEQLFCFTDKGGRRVTLRPELTPSLARMILGKGKSLTFPLKWFSIPQCWRYEKMSRGRRREHYQWNMDVWGVTGVEAEAELIAAVVSCFETLGLSACEVGIKVNSRRLLNEIMSHAGTVDGIDEGKWSTVCVIIDKLDKRTAADLEDDFRAAGLNTESLGLLLEMLAIKNLEDLDSALGGVSEGTKELRTLLGLLGNGYNISSDWVSYDGTVVRGLAYYTGVVFEANDREGKLRAICGGGRYDKLFQSMGGAFALPAVGFGFGDAVILELLRDRDLMPALSDAAADVVVFPLEESLRFKAMAVAKELRAASLRVDLVMEKERKMKWVLQRADRSGAGAVVIIAPDEHCNSEAVVRDLLGRVQSNVPYHDMVAHVGKIIQESGLLKR